MFIEHVGEAEAHGAVAAIYDRDRDTNGYLPNYTKAFSLRPDVYEAWASLNKAIKSHLDLRYYELATLAAATELRSSYCCLAHGEVLANRFFTANQVAEMASDHSAAGLTPADTAVMDFATKAARDAGSITGDDVDALRAHGFDDGDVFDIASTAAARSFFTKLLEAVGARPDAEYRRLDSDLLGALTVGRPLEED